MTGTGVRTIKAAGGVVWRPADPDHGREVVLVHRPRYGDWTLPKGKLDAAEHPLAAAVREVYEETSVHAVPQLHLPTIRYLTGEPDVEKVVDFWAMRAERWTDRAADHEIDAVRWLPVTDAAAALTYVHDRGVLKAFADEPTVTGLVLLLRHADAGERGEWPGSDAERPLDGTGADDATALADLLALYAPVRLVSATPVRCVATLTPLARIVAVPVERDARFDESADPEVAAEALRAIAATGTAVLCSQGGLIPDIVAEVTGRHRAAFKTAKGHGWVLGFDGGRLIRAEPFKP